MNRSERRRLRRERVPGSRSPGAAPAAALQQAIGMHQAGRTREAEAALTRLCQSHPEDAAALQLLGLAKMERGALDKAVKLFERSLNIDPRQPHVHNNLGNAYRRLGRSSEAEGCYREALRLKPDYVEAHFNLGVALSDLERHDAAADSFRKAVTLKPDHVQAWTALGNALRLCERLEEALEVLKTALRLHPQFAPAHHNLGGTLAKMGDHEGAIASYLAARRFGLDSYELHHNLANSRAELGQAQEAIAGYRTALARNPEFVHSHINLNNLLWEHGYSDEYLRSYKEVLSERPHAAPLYVAYAYALLRQERFDEADEVLDRGLAAAPDEPGLHHLRAQSLERREQMDEAVKAFRRCIGLAPGRADFHVSFSRCLLTLTQPEQALEHLDHALRAEPFHQLAWAYRGIAWRLLDDRRDIWLNDYERFIRPYEIPVPDGYTDLPAFLADLASTLESLHTATNSPTYQTLRGGTQTAGDLFRRREPAIVALQESLRKCIADYAARLPDDPHHPLVARRAPDFEFAGSWSVRLRRSGFHTIHVHPMGWLSSAFYVRVPEVVARDDDKAGWIKFGEPDIDVGEASRPRRFVQPHEGMLVLFPSYMWHGTVPFETDDVRMTVAFDVAPNPDPARTAPGPG